MMYLRIKWDSSARRWVIDEVQPVAISRQLHPDSPEALLHPSLRPPTAPSEFSPAEHVFGWVHADGKDAKSSGYAGSVRFGPVVCTSDNAIEKFDQPNTLPILDRPKPEQSRFYLGVSKNGTVVPFDKKMSKQEIRYAAGSGRALRGRKVYPTQNRQPKRTNNQRGKQNQSYHDQVRAGTEFRFEVNVRNLSSSELGALLTVLDLDNAVNDGTHRHLGFGGAKPLGYGSVSTVVDWPRSNLRSGTEDTLAFCELRAPQPDNESARATVADFVSLVSGRPFFEAFKIATKGYGSDVPVHYPRVEPSTGDANKDTLEWFMVNESDRELRHPLPPLSANRDGKMTTHAPRSRGGGPRRR
jgi:CRISPR-associated protein (TIGR03986 family)